MSQDNLEQLLITCQSFFVYLYAITLSPAPTKITSTENVDRIQLICTRVEDINKMGMNKKILKSQKNIFGKITT